MKTKSFPLLASLLLAIFAVGLPNAVVAQESSGHDHEAMKKTEHKIAESMKSLSDDDQKLAAAQRFCPIMTYSRLGSMGTPIKLTIEGKPVFVCCKGCAKGATKDEAAALKITKKLIDSTAVLAKLPAEERMAVEAQKYCAIASDNFLGSMGAPIKLELDGKPVYLCCGGCKKKAEANPAATLAKVEELKKAGKKKGEAAKS